MSLKPVELQIALPRTTEISRIQQDHQSRSMQEQQALAGQTIKQSQEMSQRSTGVDEASESSVRDDGSRGNTGSQGHSGQSDKGKEREAEHPYLGRRFDVSL